MIKNHNHSIRNTLITGLILSIYILMSIAFATNIHSRKLNHLSYTDIGQGEPLMLIHAFPFDQRLWQAQLDNLSSRFRIITIDLWGFGHSEKIQGESVSMDDYAEEIKLLLDNLHIKKAFIGGESMGGYVSLAFLNRNPEYVKGLILSDTNAIAPNPQQKEAYYKNADDIKANGPATFIQGFITKAVSKQAPDNIKDIIRKIMNDQTPNDMSAALRGIAERYDTSNVLRQTLIPILIITGEDDQVIPPQQSDVMHALAKNSRLVVIKNAGHLSNLEQPEEWNRAVIEMFG